MEKNICHFVPYTADHSAFHTVNFVLENNVQIYSGLRAEALYKAFCVFNGRGRLHVMGKTCDICVGDVFFISPATYFAIETVEDLSYSYVSYIGQRAAMLMDNIGSYSPGYVFHGCDMICEMWKKCLAVGSEFSGLASESALLYAFAFISEKNAALSNKKKFRESDAVALIKKCIDDNFSRVDFSLEFLEKELKYNRKYMSYVFKKKMNVGIVEYLSTVRVQNACTMMSQGSRSVGDIAFRCGFSDPQYFSRVFRKKMGMPPKSYIASIDAS
ncbi:MAG: helix-turn-helix transcriptional regulator [Clostridia bacterium]|nr:helix-turn-helix transcriptional regulator [Clostridia bacterium]